MSPELFQQIEELYHAARQAAPKKREALLARADPELRWEVESLLSQQRSGEFLDRPAIQNAPELLACSILTSLAAGACLGPYRIEGKLGEGGMGEVFRAVDTRLGRAVAIKTMREQFSARFEREARAISSLNHPHICTLFDVGPNYLVMELVEGETLAARLKRGPLPARTALLYGSQILSALAEAHCKGIVHRDLKPGNIMIAKSGIKVLDFGLAKSGQDESATASHVVMGTPAYMAPEQRGGKAGDARSDIYSFGCLLYEMLTGARAGTQRRRIPSRRLEKIVNRCLEENPKRRWQSAGELERELADVSPPGSRWKLALAAALTLLILFATGYLYLNLTPKLSRAELQLRQLTTNSAENPVWHSLISPDGKYLAYADAAGIKIRLISTGESHLLPRPELVSAGDAWFPAAWFPDGTRILANSITSAAVLSWTIPVVGGKIARVRDNALIQSISPDGSLIAFTAGSEAVSAANTNNEIWVMGPRGENARRVVHDDRATAFDCVRWSPDGNRIAYLRFRNDSPHHSLTKVFADYTLESSDLGGNSRTIILSNQHSRIYAGRRLDSFSWVPPGRVIYTIRESEANSRDTNLWEITVESKTGKPVLSPRRLTNLAGFEMDSLSATTDGKRLLFESISDQSHVYVGRLLPGGRLETPRRLTLDERHNSPYAWTPDSKAVIFRSDRTGIGSIYKQAIDEDEPDLIPTGSDEVDIIRVSPDGKWLVYQALPRAQSSKRPVSVRIMRVPLAGGGPEVIFETNGADVDLDCARRPGAQCLESERGVDGRAFVFYGFDPIKDKRRKLFELAMAADKSLNMILSPDGTRIALTGTDPKGRIEIRSLAGHIESTIELKGWPSPLSIDWAADGEALFVSHPGLIASPSGPIGATLFRVDLQGHAQPIWETRGGRYTWGINSPDGKYLAIREPMTERNAWMVENF